MQANPELLLAEDFIRDTGYNIFLTGKAGTGKTTFLHTLKKESHKRIIVTAPTGVAAINAGGVTLHSFFQLPFGPYLPDSAASRSQYRFSKEKIGIIKSLDLLVIDEISMVRADLLDGVDSVLRRYRRSNQPFGGVQLLMIGDLFQLPPVVKDGEWKFLRNHYDSPYFFSSSALSKTEQVTIELQHIYRQEDNHFIDLLNRVRENSLDSSSLNELNKCYIADFVPADRDGYITLCTHNRDVDAINYSKLKALTEKAYQFKADVEGEFPDYTFPTAATLELKKGAQVMFVRNDLSPDKRYFNGKIGTVLRVSGKNIWVRCSEDEDNIVVEPAIWENIEYKLNQETQEITENKIGTFTQYPLKLAWAITIHKSQGLTFDKAIIDPHGAFAHGQVYVALSRCRTLEGMVLRTPLALTSVKTDGAVLNFSKEMKHNFPGAEQLAAAKIRYQQRLLLECFDFQQLRSRLRRLTGLLLGNSELIHVSGISDIRELMKVTEDEICTVGDNFLRQLHGLFKESVLPAGDAAVLERITKASSYFQDKIAAGVGNQIPHLQIDTDNKELRKKVKKGLKLLQEEIGVKLAAVKCCEEGFSPSQYFRAVSAAEVTTSVEKRKAKRPTYSETDIAHPELFQTLKEWRSKKAKDESVPHYQVLHQKTLIQIAVNLPDSTTALQEIKGIGKRLSERYGEELVNMVSSYREQHNIKEVALPSPPPVDPKPKRPKAPKVDTKQISLELLEKGLTLPQIAEERDLTLATIEGHIAHFVERGKVAINTLVSPKKQQETEQEILQMSGESLREIKLALGDNVSYGEIKLIQAHLKHLEK